MEDRETPRMRKYGESKTTRIMMATVRHVTSSSGLRKFQADGFLLDGVYNMRVRTSRLSALSLWLCLIMRRDAACFLARGTTISPLWLPGNSTFHAAFGIHESDSCLCLNRVEAAEQAQAGFWDTSWLTLVWGSWNGKRDHNKDVYFVDKISNSAGHK